MSAVISKKLDGASEHSGCCAAAAPEYQESMRRRQLLCNWSGPFFVVFFFIGLVLFMGFVPPQSPLASSQQIADIYLADLTSIRIGIVLCSYSVALMATWGAALAARTLRTEREFPVYTYTQIACVGVGVMVAVFCFLTWAVAAFRPDDVHPDITRMLNDVGWFLFLFDVAPFMVWMVAVGLAILGNRSSHRLMPRWVGYFSLWCAVGEAPAVLILFFKDGAFAFNGLVGFWLPLVAFFLWIMVLSVVLHQEIQRDAVPQAMAGRD
ncbi:MAG: hypothetical protein WC809_06255 [Sinimarinibacterium sp.]|jgi:hypothetical protein